MPNTEGGIADSSGARPGYILLGPPPAPAAECRTFIATGLGRSGTSMVADILAEAGLLSRVHAYEVTSEDRELLDAFVKGNRRALIAAIAARNQAYPVWAFKIPSIQGFLEANELALFRRPHLIVVMRDLVATASRHAAAEHIDPRQALFETASGQAELMAFVQRVTCPVLAISYEKAIAHPDKFIRSLLDFMRLRVSPELEARLAARVEPENAKYAMAATRRFEGNIDGMFDGVLIGWCRDAGDAQPVEVDLLADGIAVARMRADCWREDLASLGIGNGRHGFAFDTSRLHVSPTSVLSVRIAGRTYEVPGSGGSIFAYER